MYVASDGPVPPPPPDVTVTVLCLALLPSVAVTVVLPAATAVTWNEALDCPDPTIALAGTVATVGEDDTNWMVVAVLTAALIPAVNDCELPGASDSVPGISVCKVGVAVPPPLGVPPVATNK